MALITDVQRFLSFYTVVNNVACVLIPLGLEIQVYAVLIKIFHDTL